MRGLIRRLLAATLLSGFPGIIVSVLAAPAAPDWFRYENNFFIAYSNAPEEKALDILAELEYIRAAAEQTPNFVIPEGRPKTLLLLPATQEEFARFAPYETMAGFAQPLDGGAAIVMPVSGSNRDSRAVIRHEYAHTLLFNEWFSYPQWYAEGFAEIVSGISVNRRRNSFAIGEKPSRYGRRLEPMVAWHELIATDFNAHGLADEKLIQSAYAQDWLLVHFLTLSSHSDHASQLNRYFALLTSGRSSPEAFGEAFGTTADDLWQTELQRYANKVPVVSRDFDPRILDTEFTRADVPQGELQPMLRYFTDKADARRTGGEPMPPITTVPGRWDQLRLNRQCADPLTFALRTGSDVIVIEGFYSADDDHPVPALFAYERTADGVFNLTNITASEFPNVMVTSDFRLSVKGKNVFCFDQEPVGRPCSSIFHRCDRPD